MFSKVLDLTVFPDEEQAFNFLYPLFHRDFVAQNVYLADSIYVNPQGQGMRDGREKVFWHITTRENKVRVKEGNRYQVITSRPLDPDRAKRIEWVKTILLNHAHADIKCFYRKETKGKKPIRFYLWAHQQDFVVIVQKLGASESFLVTCFYITEVYKREDYAKWFNEYQSGTNPELQGCEWF
ncbi:RlfB protein [Parashewanella curva]|uniref:RlfB protein n=1 Tax=Parashewanella curva TaxID=2338552 RepID=A0A3L8PYS6_9GAMM|nr:RlfB protein [Parashewanella curva]RLV60501.1 RlfB protein [Parashewanella curva]